MNWQGKWITSSKDMGDLVPAFTKSFDTDKEIDWALLNISAIGVYEASINGLPITDQVLTPGWTAYRYRIQYQTYDVSHLISQKNTIEVTVGKGWHKSPLMGFEKSSIQQELMAKPTALIAELHIYYTDGQKEIIPTNDTWTYCESAIRFSEIYDGEIYDASFDRQKAVKEPVITYDMTRDILVPDQGEAIKEIDRIHPSQILVTPKGEYVIDFGQEITGYVELTLSAASGDLVELSHGEVFDKEGNFYNDNYRDAKAKLTYTCSDGVQVYKPHHTFYGFRYVRIDAFPGGPQSAGLENFKGIVVHSDMERTGHLSSSNSDLNQLFDNIIWGQKGNFLDVPTDCPQRNERLGWTGDAQVFVKTAAYNYNVENFFTKWLKDLALDQKDNGQVGFVIPDVLNEGGSSAWGDAATICPWEIYLAYGNPKILENQFESMKKWISYIKDHTTTPNLGLEPSTLATG